VAGDPAYAAPEQLYEGGSTLTLTQGRLAADMYTFGGLVCFLLTTVPYSGLFQMHLECAFGWRQWQGTFSGVLPALVDTHGMSVSRLEGVLNREIASDIAEIIWQLCHPDPSVRGDPKARRTGHNPFRLERYISRLNLVHRRASYGIPRRTA
jgi:hypothetical protein